MSKIIVVLGMHRSGTSVLTRALTVFGVNLGENLIPEAPDNEKGFWEDQDVYQLNLDLLAFLGHDWHTLPIIPAELLRGNGVEKFRDRARDILLARTNRATVFGVKDPRMARMLDFWKPVFQELRLDVSYVVAIRNPISVAESLAKREHMDAEKSHYLWLEHLTPAVLETEGSVRIVADYDLLLERPEQEMWRLAAGLGMADRVDFAALKEFEADFLEEGLRHSQYRPEDLAADPSVTSLVIEAYELLSRAAKDEISIDSETVRVAFRRFEAELARMAPALRYMARYESLLGTCIRDAADRERILHEEVSKRYQHILALRQEVAERDQHILTLRQEIAERDQHILVLRQEVTERDQHISALNQEVADREARLGARIAEVDALRNSASWRITAPIRLISRQFRRAYGFVRR